VGAAAATTSQQRPISSFRPQLPPPLTASAANRFEQQSAGRGETAGTEHGARSRTLSEYSLPVPVPATNGGRARGGGHGPIPIQHSARGGAYLRLEGLLSMHRGARGFRNVRKTKPGPRPADPPPPPGGPPVLGSLVLSAERGRARCLLPSTRNWPCLRWPHTATHQPAPGDTQCKGNTSRQ
jgi:hypothetical protein